MSGFVANADRRAFQDLFAEVFEPVRRYLVRRTDEATADDVAAETMLVLWRRPADVPADARVAWAIGVARLQLKNAERSRRRQDRLVNRIIVVDPPAETVPERNTSTDERVARAMAGLRDAEAEIVRLWAWEELTVPEIAHVLSISANAVSVRLHRAKRKLADRLRIDDVSGGKGEELS